MLVSESILEQALAQVFDGKAAGARMTLADISAAWSAVGLRKSDLRDAIREMIESHCLAPLNIAGALAFALTEHGALRFDISRHHAISLQAWLSQRRESHAPQAAADPLSSTWDRRIQ